MNERELWVPGLMTEVVWLVFGFVLFMRGHQDPSIACFGVASIIGVIRQIERDRRRRGA